MKYIKFTGDRTTDRIMNHWLEGYYKRDSRVAFIEDFTDNQLDELMYRVGMEDFVNYVLQEFPQVANVGFDYDVLSTWEMFLENTKVGYDVEEALSEFLEDSMTIDNDLVVEYIDNNAIVEAYNGSDALDIFFEKNPIGKKLSAKDKKAMKIAFKEGEMGEFANGYSFYPSEFVTVVMSDGDEEGHTVKDIHDYVRKHEKNNFEFVYDGYVIDSELSKIYGGIDVYTCWAINFEDIAKNAL